MKSMRITTYIVLTILVIGSLCCRQLRIAKEPISVKEMKASRHTMHEVDVSGMIQKDYHGLLLCDQTKTPCVFVWEDDDKIPLIKDQLYAQFRRLSIEIGYPDKARTPGARIVVT